MIALPSCAAQANSDGLKHFAAGHPALAERWLRHAYRLRADEPAILVNLGLAFAQQGQLHAAERCYRLALAHGDQRTRRSAAKNLGFVLLWKGEFNEGWHWHGQRFAGETFLAHQWRGEPLNGQTLTVWNDVGMGDAFQFVRYTLPLLQRGERVRWAVDRSQVKLFRQRLAWPLTEVVDQRQIDRCAGPHIPLMSLIPLLDPATSWGRHFRGPTWQLEAQTSGSAVGLCWASNPSDRTMHAYKSTSPERLLALTGRERQLISLQTDEASAHQRLGLAPARRCWLSTLDEIGACRQVISVDTAVAHLAAGAGKPVTLLLGHPPDWRWQPFGGTGQPPHQLWYHQLRVEPL